MFEGKPSIGRIFDANKFRIWLMIALVMLSSIGFAFPLLAAIICMSVWNVTFVTQFMMYSLLDRVKREEPNNVYEVYVKQLESDFKDAGNFFDLTVLRTCHMLLTLFMCFFVFDMVGDTNGWIVTIIVVIIFFITSAITSAMLLYGKEISIKMLSKLFFNRQQRFNSKQNDEFETENPMNL